MWLSERPSILAVGGAVPRMVATDFATDFATNFATDLATDFATYFVTNFATTFATDFCDGCLRRNLGLIWVGEELGRRRVPKRADGFLTDFRRHNFPGSEHCKLHAIIF